MRLAAATGVAVDRDTLLRLVKALPEPAGGPVPVLGVDDFAFHKGRHYLAAELNNRPRLCLNDRTPAQLMRRWHLPETTQIRDDP